jgi:hypothetical protein
MGVTQHATQEVTRVLSSGIKPPGHESDISALYGA